MSLTEREKEIAISAAAQFDNGTEECHVVIHNSDISVMFDLFLSCVRDEQEAVAWMVYDGEGFNLSASKQSDADLPLFTIPPATLDCKELVEALEKIASCESKVKGDVIDIAKEALANHAKRMKGKRE